MNNLKVVIDAGHGGTDSGAVSGNVKEKDYFLEVINLIDSIIKEINELNNDKQHIEEEIQSNENELFSDLN
ncbi:MAG: N-acetylmuramoyl-L-alanine amidase [Bacilli bacterium]|nr:N-acetylmuramoyl-L-alanine amidase [Bacilli bacterium]